MSCSINCRRGRTKTALRRPFWKWMDRHHAINTMDTLHSTMAIREEEEEGGR